jgi:hypothetical protein
MDRCWSRIAWLLLITASPLFCQSSAVFVQTTDCCSYVTFATSEDKIVGKSLSDWEKEVRSFVEVNALTYVIVHSSAEWATASREIHRGIYAKWVKDQPKDALRFQRPRIEIVLRSAGSRLRRFNAGVVEELFMTHNADGQNQPDPILAALQFAQIPRSMAQDKRMFVFIQCPDPKAFMDELISRGDPLHQADINFILRPDRCFGMSEAYPKINRFAGDVSACPETSDPLPPSLHCIAYRRKLDCYSAKER